MKSIISIISVMIFSAASVSLQAASPWEYEYWFTGSGGDNAPDTPFNLRVAAPGGGQFSGGDSQGGSNNNNSAPSFSDLVNINIDDLSPQQQQQQQDTGFGSEWIVLAAIDTELNRYIFGERGCPPQECEGRELNQVRELDIDGPPGPGATKAIVGGLEIGEATLRFAQEDGSIILQSVASDGSVKAIFGVDQGPTLPRSITSQDIPVFTKIEIQQGLEIGQVIDFLNFVVGGGFGQQALNQFEQLGLSFQGTGFNGAPQNGGNQGLSGSTITIGFGFQQEVEGFPVVYELLGGDDESGPTTFQIVAVGGFISDDVRANNGRFSPNNFFVPDGATVRDRAGRLTYRYTAGYTTSQADLQRVVPTLPLKDKVLAGIQGRTGTYNGTSLHNKYDVKLQIDFTNAKWDGNFSHNYECDGCNLDFKVDDGTVAGNRFNGDVVTNKRIETGEVIGFIGGSEAQLAAGATSVTYTDHRKIPEAYKNVTEEDVFSAVRKGVRIVGGGEPRPGDLGGIGGDF